MPRFRDLRLRNKLMSGYLVVSALTVVVGWIALRALMVEDARFTRVSGTHFEGARLLADAGIAFNRMRTLTAQSLLAGDVREAETFKTTYDQLAKQLETDLAEAREHLTSEASRERLAEAERAYQSWKTGNQEAWRLSLAGRPAEGFAELMRNKVNALAANDGLETILKQKHDLIAAETTSQVTQFARTRLLLATSVALALLLSLGLALIIARQVEEPVRRGMELMEAVAEGDFTRTLGLDSRDEIGRLGGAMDTTVTRVRDALSEVSRTAQTVAVSADQLTAASGSISTGAQEQASSLEETAASLEQITGTVRRNADSSQQAAELARRAREVAEQGGDVVGRAVRSMAEINASSKRIADIITAIDEIAFQTNLLALNAAVEAARAGEQGRGFAVVAGEVRNLAQRAASSAKEIKGLIHDSVGKVESGSELVNQSGRTLEEIVASVQRVHGLVSEIAAASREQAAGIEQVGKAVSQMDQVTQANAAQTEELASTAESLSAQAERLTELVSRFHLGSGGLTTAARSAAPAPATPAASATPARVIALPTVVPAPVAQRRTGTDDAEFTEY